MRPTLWTLAALLISCGGDTTTTDDSQTGTTDSATTGTTETVDTGDTETGGTTDTVDTEDPVADRLVIPIAALTTDKTLFTHPTPEANVLFFAMIGPDGQPHVAFDACENCDASGELGYRHEGDEMVCNSCDQRFKINGLGTANKVGGCWPGHLPVTETGTNLELLYTDIEAGTWYFTR